MFVKCTAKWADLSKALECRWIAKKHLTGKLYSVWNFFTPVISLWDPMHAYCTMEKVTQSLSYTTPPLHAWFFCCLSKIKHLWTKTMHFSIWSSGFFRIVTELAAYRNKITQRKKIVLCSLGQKQPVSSYGGWAVQDTHTPGLADSVSLPSQPAPPQLQHTRAAAETLGEVNRNSGHWLNR